MTESTKTEKLTALDVLRRDGWHKGSFLGPNGEHCIRGALHVAYGFDVVSPEYWAIESVISEQYAERAAAAAARNPIVAFNDHPDTTFADVEAVCEKAELRLSERVA